MRYYTDKIHEVIKLSLDNLRASRTWEAEAFKDIAYNQYRLTQLMRNASNTRIKKLYKQALILEEEAWKIAND